MRGTDRARRGGPGYVIPGLLVVVLAALLLVGCVAPEPATRSSPAPALSSAGPAPPDDPVGVRIPAIAAGSSLLRLGIAADGTAEVPADADRAGWFARGGRPDGAGPTVVLGHVDSRSGPAVFFRMRDLAPGDVVELDLADGRTARYTVERLEQVAKDAFPTFAVFGATADDVLRLVTCAGVFDRAARSYTDNLVVHATRI